jgi:hypothetical protein
MTELTDIVHKTPPPPEPTIDELKLQVSQLKIDLAIRDGRILDLERDNSELKGSIRAMDREIGDTRRLAAQTSFLSNELASQVAVQRTFIGAMDRAAAALVEKDVKKAAKIVKYAREGNPFEAQHDASVKAEAKKLLDASPDFEPIGSGTVTNGRD